MIKTVISPNYNYKFDHNSGLFLRWGKNLEDDPEMSPLGAEIVDMEISTICEGVGGKVCNFCFPAGAIVNTPSGNKQIESIEVGDIVYSAVACKKPSLMENIVQETYNSFYSGELIVLELEDDNVIEVTPEHPFFTRNRGWVEAKDLLETDILVDLNELKKCKHCNNLLVWRNSYRRYYCSSDCYVEKNTKTCLICKKSFIDSKRKNFCEKYVVFGRSHHSLRETYSAMIYRCYDARRNSYKYYGKKGIRVEKEWLVFDRFLRDMGRKPKGYTLDRIDNNKNYSKDNCRWVSIEEQRVNRRRYGSQKYKGVMKHGKKYVSNIRHKNKSYYLGTFEKEIDAAQAYDNKLKEFYPETFHTYINLKEENYEN